MSIYDIPESLIQAVYGVMDEAKVKKEPNRFEIGGDAYDGGVYLVVYVNNKKVHSDDRVGEQDWQYKGAKGLKNVLKKLAKEHGVKEFQRVALESVQISKDKEILGESKGDAVVDKLITDVADSTDRNDHTGSLVLIAKWMKDRRALKRLEAIETIAMLDGSLDPHIAQYRTSVMKTLLKNAKSRMPKEQFDSLNGAL